MTFHLLHLRLWIFLPKLKQLFDSQNINFQKLRIWLFRERFIKYVTCWVFFELSSRSSAVDFWILSQLLFLIPQVKSHVRILLALISENECKIKESKPCSLRTMALLLSSVSISSLLLWIRERHGMFVSVLSHPSGSDDSGSPQEFLIWKRVKYVFYSSIWCFST